MKTWVAIGLIAMLGLAGCQRKDDAGSGGLLRPTGRFEGVGLYPASRMWTEVRQASAAKDPLAAVLKDDEEIIVTIDGRTGELRQCGNLSGYCITMNPWGRPADAAAPVPLARHAEQLDAQAASPPATRP